MAAIHGLNAAIFLPLLMSQPSSTAPKSPEHHHPKKPSPPLLPDNTPTDATTFARLHPPPAYDAPPPSPAKPLDTAMQTLRAITFALSREKHLPRRFKAGRELSHFEPLPFDQAGLRLRRFVRWTMNVDYGFHDAPLSKDDHDFARAIGNFCLDLHHRFGIVSRVPPAEKERLAPDLFTFFHAPVSQRGSATVERYVVSVIRYCQAIRRHGGYRSGVGYTLRVHGLPRLAQKLKIDWTLVPALEGNGDRRRMMEARIRDWTAEYFSWIDHAPKDVSLKGVDYTADDWCRMPFVLNEVGRALPAAKGKGGKGAEACEEGGDIQKTVLRALDGEKMSQHTAREDWIGGDKWPRSSCSSSEAS